MPLNLNLPLALTAGMVAAFNPCGVVLLPSYIAFLITQKERSQDKIAFLIFEGLKIGSLMTAGFISVFVITGLLLSWIGTFFMTIAPWLSIIIGIILVLTGILLLFKPEKINIKSISNTLANRAQQKNPYNYFLYGIGYALVSLGCTLPVFMMVVITNFTIGNINEGILSFGLYGLGMGIVVTLISIFSLIARKAVEKWIQQVIPYMHYIVSILVIFTGIYIIYYWFLGPGRI